MFLTPTNRIPQRANKFQPNGEKETFCDRVGRCGQWPETDAPRIMDPPLSGEVFPPVSTLELLKDA